MCSKFCKKRNTLMMSPLLRRPESEAFSPQSTFGAQGLRPPKGCDLRSLIPTSLPNPPSEHRRCSRVETPPRGSLTDLRSYGFASYNFFMKSSILSLLILASKATLVPFSIKIKVGYPLISY